MKVRALLVRVASAVGALLGLVLVAWGGLLAMGAGGFNPQGDGGVRVLGVACLVLGGVLLFLGVQGLYTERGRGRT